MKKLLYASLMALLISAMITTTVFAGYTISPKILAGQGIDGEFVGVAKITGEYDGFLTIELMLKGGEGFCISDAAVHLGTSLADFPTNKGGAIPGQFDYQYDFAPCTSHPAPMVIYVPQYYMQSVIIAIHVNVYNIFDQEYQETGWVVNCGNLEGGQFPGKNWSAWLTFPANAWY